MKFLSDPFGFTTKELLMTFIVIGILCALAIPPYYMMTESREVTRMEQAMQKIRVQLHDLYNSKGAYPDVLDNQTFPAVCQTCFSSINNSVRQQNLWFKKNQNTYYFSPNGAGQAESDFLEKGDYQIVYLPQEGRMVTQQNH